MPSPRLTRALIWLSLPLAVGGCAERWAKPGAGAAEFDAMQAACSAQGYARFPPVLQQMPGSPGFFAPGAMRCGGPPGARSCYAVGGVYVPPSIVTVDLNAAGRGQDIRACFYANGWSPVQN